MEKCLANWLFFKFGKYSKRICHFHFSDELGLYQSRQAFKSQSKDKTKHLDISETKGNLQTIKTYCKNVLSRTMCIKALKSNFKMFCKKPLKLHLHLQSVVAVTGVLCEFFAAIFDKVNCKN